MIMKCLYIYKSTNTDRSQTKTERISFIYETRVMDSPCFTVRKLRSVVLKSPLRDLIQGWPVKAFI